MHGTPRPWLEERSFHDLVYDWMERAPWLALSAAAHLLLYFLLAALPWDQFGREPVRTLQASLQLPPAEVFEPRVEPPLDPVDTPDVSEPMARTQDLEPQQDASSELDSDTFAELLANPVAFESGDVPLIGLGGGPPPGGFHGPRGDGHGRVPHGTAGQAALRAALAWLQAHQSRDGRWDGDGFMQNCGLIGANACDGPGGSTHDVGVTGLALLAFLGDGNSTTSGEYKDVVARGITWLKNQQDPDSGLIGERTGHDFLYDHALGTLALCEAYYASHSPLIKGAAQKAVELIVRARAPYGAWRYDLPSIGDSDTSLTGWMVFALASAREAGLEADYRSAFDGALTFLDEVTDPASGRVGYQHMGELSSRTTANEHYPREKGEAMTAVGLLCRIFLGQKPEDHPILLEHAELLKSRPPVWDPDGHGCDMYYWYYGTYAMYQLGKPYWPVWEKAMKAAVVDSQRKDGDCKGSWDPLGPWGWSGGRVYSTAVMTLSLEVYFRYAQVLGAR